MNRGVLLRLLLVTFALATSESCRCGPGVLRTEVTVEVPEAVDFGTVPLGYQSQRSVLVRNNAGAPTTVRLSVEGPFLAGGEVVLLPAGGEVEVAVAFSPVALGDAHGLLQLVLVEGQQLSTPLSGVGLPACAAPKACREVFFDEQAGQCGERILADDAACQTQCLQNGVCRAGECIGEPIDCHDADICTDDSCVEGEGCVHPPTECPIDDPCQVARCDAAQGGCVTSPVADGVACGEATCATAKVCINGACVSRATPNAAMECTYTDVCVGQGYACASTRSGKLRCWGRGEALQRWGFDDVAVVPPTTIPGVTNVAAPLCHGTSQPRWLTPEGEIEPFDVFATSDAGMAALQEVQAPVNGADALGLDTRGRVVLVDWPTSEVWAVGGARRIFGGACVEYADGGLSCLNDHSLLVPTGRTAPDELAAYVAHYVTSDWPIWWPHFEYLELRRSVVSRSDGGVVVPGGVTALGQAAGAVIAAMGADVSVVAHYEVLNHDVTAAWHRTEVVFPDEPMRLTATSSSSTVCGISDAGVVNCWGTNTDGESGDDSTFTLTPIEVADGGFRALTCAPLLVALRGDSVVAVGTSFDGGVLPPVGSSTLLGRALLPGVTQLEGDCLLQAGTMKCNWYSQLLDYRTVATNVVKLCPGERCGVTIAGRRVCTDAIDEQRTSPWGDGCNKLCGLDSDGGYWCKVPDATAQRISFPGRPIRVWGDRDECVEVAGRIFCVEIERSDDGGFRGFTAAPLPANLRTPVRLFRGDGYGGCSVSGQNGLQCWGDGHADDIAIAGTVRDIAVSGWEYSLNDGAACALLTNGRLFCWGRNRNGELGRMPNVGQSAVRVTR